MYPRANAATEESALSSLAERSNQLYEEKNPQLYMRTQLARKHAAITLQSADTVTGLFARKANSL